MSRRSSSLAVALIIALCTSIHVSTNAQKKTKQNIIKGYGEASYTPSSGLKYMQDWLVAGPLLIPKGEGTPSDEAQVAFFKEGPSQVAVVSGKAIAPLAIHGKEFQWERVRAISDIIDLDAHFKQADFAAAYAMAEIKADKEEKIFLGIGSDDAIRVWHNGKLIHDNWIPRGVVKDDDLVPVTLQPGSNQILLKVQDLQQGWGFVVRVLDRKALSEQLIASAGEGDMDQLRLLMSAGVDLKVRNSSGLTALNSARLSGRQEVIDFLISKGAIDEAMPSLDALVNGMYNVLEGKEASGIAVLISKDGNVIFKKGFGYADIAKKELITPTTKFRIGSVTKQFTGATILKLREEGKISVDDRLSKFLPDFPRANEVTIRHLLTHTSGIHSYTSKPEFLTKVTSAITEEDLIDFFDNDDYDFNPGERWQYNNSGYFLLGYIIRQVSGMPYGDYLKKTFFEPLGMNNTGIHRSDLKLEREARGYTKGDGKYSPAVNWDMSWAGAAGALYSTVEDLHTWNEALFNGKVLKEESLRLGFTPFVLNDGKIPLVKYGFGWAINEYRGQPVIEHSGGLHGFQSQLARYTQENVTIVLLANLAPTDVNLSTARIAEFILWDKMQKQGVRSVNTAVEENVDQYAGRYDFGHGMVMIVTAEDNKLFAQLTGQPKFPIFASGEGAYFWKVVDAKIRFVKDEAGKVTHGDFEQNGQKIRVAKLEEEPLIEIDKALYDVYAGRYRYDERMVITISRDKDKIFAQATDQPRFEIHPVSERDFIVKELNARLSFVREDDGRSNKFVLDMGGQKKDVVRIEE